MNGVVNLFGLTQAQFETFFCSCSCASSVILFMIPIFSSAQVNILIRFGLGLAIAFIVWHVIPPIHELGGIGPLTAAIFAQGVSVGFVFGFIAYLVFVGIQFAGEVLDLQVGFSIVNVINPLTSQNVSILGELQLALGSIIYLIANAHHALFEGLAGSFTLVPLPYVAIQPQLETNLMAFFSQAFFSGVPDRGTGGDRALSHQHRARADDPRGAAAQRVRGRLPAADLHRARDDRDLTPAAGGGSAAGVRPDAPRT